MPSPEQLTPISVPLREQELFTSLDSSGGLTPEGSIFQRWLIFNHAVSSPAMSQTLAVDYHKIIEGDARNLGIIGQSHTELGPQWNSIKDEREERLRAQFTPRVEEPIMVFERESVGAMVGS